MEKGGEDAFGVVREKGFVALADGVGGWGDEGVDPAAYSQALVANCVLAREARANESEREGGEEEAAWETQRGRLEALRLTFSPSASFPRCFFSPTSRRAGRATRSRSSSRRTRARGCSAARRRWCCRWSAGRPARPSSETRVRAIAFPITRRWDSSRAARPVSPPPTPHPTPTGVLQCRRGAVVFNSPSQQHRFNCPYQLGDLSLVPEADSPESAMVFDLPLEPGDFLVMGTDGVFDNVFPEEIAELCDTYGTADAAVEAIAVLAFQRSQDPTFLSPFALASRIEDQRELAEYRRGNKSLRARFQEITGLGVAQGGKVRESVPGRSVLAWSLSFPRAAGLLLSWIALAS